VFIKTTRMKKIITGLLAFLAVFSLTTSSAFAVSDWRKQAEKQNKAQEQRQREWAAKKKQKDLAIMRQQMQRDLRELKKYGSGEAVRKMKKHINGFNRNAQRLVSAVETTGSWKWSLAPQSPFEADN